MSIKFLINSQEINIRSTGIHITRCDNFSSFKLILAPENFSRLTIFYAFPDTISDVTHITQQEVFEMKLKSKKNMGEIIVSDIKEKILAGYKFFFINPAGIDSSGVEIILDYITNLFENSEKNVSIVLVMQHKEYHFYFEDDSVVTS
ncbi:hypothetical protein [Dyadobacter psychrotolerans]|uniref:Uncharacterized protein n=1 Tax=Dyadobacter psychrotolerans TaxID=2541721 RepID=A0A4R5DK78_9BACT|nr:hypothetical protein [Dyadobacter psychrotolerans]TDE13787.1 hypothetical protein E0F88_18000 [Dyadobacter psychrotolerans]